ncbi:MAG: DegT/DnrJ/EryC1/StrS family aminotransferase [bacterium]|nr:DegT/DnrJ/EryC1/StrS family aminotransferase [bacterium]
MIPVFRPKMNKEEILPELEKIFDAGWIGLGPKTAEFEEKFADYIGVKYAIGVNSATSALHLANYVLGIKQGDEVVVPSMTFVSTALACLYCGATPVFADVEEDTLCIDPENIKEKITPKTKAIIPVHYGGHACKMDEIMEIANKHNLWVIEDNSHGCGGKYKGVMLGSIGIMGCFSFHAVKNLPTGDGGMITTNDKRLYNELKKLRWLGIDKGTWERSSKESYSWEYKVDRLGFKYHMNDITAVIGLAQLKVVDEHNLIRRKYAKKYDEAFKDVKWVVPLVEKDYAYSSRHIYAVKILMRDELNRYLYLKGISTGVHYKPIHHFKIFGNVKVNLPITEKVWHKLLTLPLYPDMSDEEFEKIVNEIIKFGKEKEW